MTGAKGGGRKRDRKAAAEVIEHVATMVADLAGLVATHADDMVEWLEKRRESKRETEGE